METAQQHDEHFAWETRPKRRGRLVDVWQRGAEYRCQIIAVFTWANLAFNLTLNSVWWSSRSHIRALPLFVRWIIKIDGDSYNIYVSK